MKITEKQAKKIGAKLGISFDDYDLKEFTMGIDVESEHANVVGKNPESWAKIAIAHLDEVPDYYTLLKKYVEK